MLWKSKKSTEVYYEERHSDDMRTTGKQSRKSRKMRFAYMRNTEVKKIKFVMRRPDRKEKEKKDKQ